MIMMDLPYQKAACRNCPFKKDVLKGWLGESRAKEIVECDSFVCHKRNDLQCAGHMVVNKYNAFVRLARSMNLPVPILNKEKIVDSPEQFIANHK